MSGIEAIGILASVIEIARFASAVTKFISELSDDASGLRSTLGHLQNNLEGVKNVFQNLQVVIKEQDLSESDSLVLIVSSSAEHCEGIVKGLERKLPELAKGAGIGQKAKVALDKKLKGKVIEEQLEFLNQYIRITDLALSTIESRKLSKIDAKLTRLESVIQDLTTLPAYSPDNAADFYRLKGNIDNFRDVATKEKTQYDPDAKSVYDRREDTRSLLPGADQLHPVLQDLLKDARPSVQPHNDTMDALESKGMLYKAAHAELSPDENPKVTERRADLLIKCPTVRSHQEALVILRELWDSEIDEKKDIICPERLGQVGSKLARLYLDSQSLGHFTEKERDEDLEMASDVLHRSLDVLMSHLPTLRPFPCNTVLTVGELLITFLKETGKSSVASSVQDALPKRIKTELPDDPVPNRSDWPHSEWPRTFKPLMPRSLTWCGEENITALLEKWPANTAVVTRPDDLNLKFNIQSLEFRFDEAVGGISPFQLAVIYGEKDVVGEMLREVKDVNGGSQPASTPLMETALNGKDDIAQMLIDHGASIERVDGKKRTVLHWAQTAEARHGVRMAKLFLGVEKGPIVEMKDGDGKTALYLACEAGNSEMVELLINEGKAKVNVTDPFGKTALHATVDAKDRLGERYKIARLLLEARAEPNTSDRHKRTPLCTACARGHVELVKVLLDHKADPDRPGQGKRTPLIEATKRNLENVVWELMLKRADPREKDATGQNAHNYAQLCPKTSTIKELLSGNLTSLPRRTSHLSVQSESPRRSNTADPTTASSSQSSRRSTVPASEQPVSRRMSFWGSKSRKKPRPPSDALD
ncbi:ankyrin repeat-containing domain protein [Apiospora arundinis]|uniref:Ankyrin repeat-containing domain protein n=1 Tax=Apiospora arundinis TaxID=335852 RepID=A0ABR2IVV5_9PEZI